MIISVSRRTDIPAFYAEWFSRRLKDGFCLVPNPFRRSQVSRVSLRKEDVDAFVFWTRNPMPFMAALDEVDRVGRPYYFLFTITGYGPPLEPLSPPAGTAARMLMDLSRRAGPDRVIWRYDPILIAGRFDPAWHRANFRSIAASVEGGTVKAKVSFLDLYRKTARRLAAASVSPDADFANSPAALGLLAGLKEIAGGFGMAMETCAEDPALSASGVPPGACVDPVLIERISGSAIERRKDPGQRPLCLCAPSRDIGMTDSCGHGCVYCYAVSDAGLAARNMQSHDPSSPSLLPHNPDEPARPECKYGRSGGPVPNRQGSSGL